MEEDIEILEKMIENANIENADMNDCFCGDHIEALENLIKGYKEKEEDLKLHEKTSFEFQEENIKLNKVINKMAEFMAGGNYYNYATKEMVIKEFMEEVENE